MRDRDHYSVLGLKKFSSSENIKKTYKKLAKENHPDLGGSTERFLEIKEAYDVLGNQERKEKYDEYLRKKRSSAIIRKNYSSDIQKEIKNVESTREFIKRYEEYMMMHSKHIHSNISLDNASHFFAINLLLGISGVFVQTNLSYITTILLFDSLFRIFQFWSKNPLKQGGLMNLLYAGSKFITDRISSKIL